MDVSVHTVVHGDVVVVQVAGEIDVYTAASLREKLADLIDADHTDVVVDLTGVTFMDSTGLGVLVGALKKVRGYGGAPSAAVAQAEGLQGLPTHALAPGFP